MNGPPRMASANGAYTGNIVFKLSSAFYTRLYPRAIRERRKHASTESSADPSPAATGA